MRAKLGTSMKNVLNEDFSGQWESESDAVDNANHDTHLVVRETPAWKVRERWAQIRLLIHERTLERDLVCSLIVECNDFEENESLVVSEEETSWWEDFWDKINVFFCVFSHLEPKYRRGDSFYECPTCHRKYAVPWADVSNVDSDTYITSRAAIKPVTPTLQAVCRNGTRGMA